jgi:hypothetical protein
MLIFSQAIKEAQKTLDKALDIQEGDEPAQEKQGKARSQVACHRII